MGYSCIYNFLLSRYLFSSLLSSIVASSPSFVFHGIAGCGRGELNVDI